MESSEDVATIQFDETRRAYCFYAKRSTNPQDIISKLSLTLPKGIICISGGAKKLPYNTVAPITKLIETAIAPVVYSNNLLVLDGGTETGVMEIVGKTLRKVKYRRLHGQNQFQEQSSAFQDLPLIGFVPESQISYPGNEHLSQHKSKLDPNHTYFVLVEDAQEWGEEVECMFAFIDYLSEVEHLPIVHIIANGGRITIKEAYYSVQQRRKIIVLEGSARATEVIASVLGGISQKKLIELLREHEITNQAQEIEETLFWLEKISTYKQITCFNLWSGNHERLKELILLQL